MFGTLKFRDAFGFFVGIPPQLYATGSTGGTAIPLSGANSNAFRRFTFIGLTGSGSANTTWNFWVGGASASNGTFSMIPSTSTAIFSGSGSYGVSTQFGSNAAALIELRLDAIAGLNSGITWIKPIMSITGNSGYGGVVALGGNSQYQPASIYDVNSGYVVSEADCF